MQASPNNAAKMKARAMPPPETPVVSLGRLGTVVVVLVEGEVVVETTLARVVGTEVVDTIGA